MTVGKTPPPKDTDHLFWKLLSANAGPGPFLYEQHYKQFRAGLISLFRYNGCHTSTELADETICRVLRIIEDGVEIRDLPAYAHTVAWNLLREYRRERSKRVELFAPSLSLSAESADQILRENCLEECKKRLPTSSRRLIEAYYSGEKSVKIANRKRLAAKLGISMDALRIRAHRIRKELAECFQDCKDRGS